MESMERFNKEFVLPRYQGGCFSNLPATIFKLFGISTNKPTIKKNYWQKYLNELPRSKLRGILASSASAFLTPSSVQQAGRFSAIKNKFRNIIVFLIDSLGFFQWQESANNFPFFKYLFQKKLVFPITAVFPSTTSAAITTFHSGLTPAGHGLFEWELYFSEIDKIIITLPFCNLYYPERDLLLKENVSPEILFSGKTIHEEFVKHKINSFLFLNQEYAQSAYSKQVTKGATVIAFSNLYDLLTKLRGGLRQNGRLNFYSIYLDEYDSLCHTYGPKSQESMGKLGEISNSLIGEFLGKISRKTKEETLVILTADHGQIAVDPSKTIYLDEDKILMEGLVKDKNGQIVLPTGSARDVFLHTRRDFKEKIFQYLTRKLKDKAVVLKIDTAIKSNLFGNRKIKKIFKERLGDILILPSKNFTIWRKYQGERFKLLGAHGGLSRQEMLVPFSIFSLKEI